jgi:hypothetical protein
VKWTALSTGGEQSVHVEKQHSRILRRNNVTGELLPGDGGVVLPNISPFPMCPKILLLPNNNSPRCSHCLLHDADLVDAVTGAEKVSSFLYLLSCALIHVSISSISCS